MISTFAYLLKLDKLHLSGVKIVRIPGIQKLNYKEVGLVYGVKYYITNKNGTTAVGFTSRDSSFKTLYSFDLYNTKDLCEVSTIMKENTDAEKFLEFVKKAFIKAEPIDHSRKHINKESDDYPTSAMKNAMLIKILLNAAFWLLAAIGGIIYYIKQVKHRYEEYNTQTNIEKEINEKLFSGQTGNESAFDIYSNLNRFLKHVINGQIKSLIIYGPSGTGKTMAIRRNFYFNNVNPGSDYIIEKGSSLGLMEVYQLFYRNKNKILVLDDFDTPLSDPDIINLLKAITDSYSKRIVSLPRKHDISTGDKRVDVDVPEKFVFEGKIIIVTNLEKHQIDKALLSRSPFIEVRFSPEETLELINKMMAYIHPEIPLSMKKEVLNYIASLRKKDPNITLDLRKFTSAIEIRYAIPEFYKDMIKVIVDYRGN